MSRYTWDLDKARVNLAKHGVSFRPPAGSADLGLAPVETADVRDEELVVRVEFRTHVVRASYADLWIAEPRRVAEGAD